MERAPRSSLIALVGALWWAPMANLASEEYNALPPIGTQVRVMAPSLGPGWHYGQFNRLRVEPPCYRVLILSGGPTRPVHHILSPGELTRIEVADHSPGAQPKSSGVAAAGKDPHVTWHEFALDQLLAAEKACGAPRGQWRSTRTIERDACYGGARPSL